MSDIDVATILNEFVAVCRDGVELYMKAAQKLDWHETGDLFLKIAEIRGETIGMLTPLVDADGRPVTTSGTVAGVAHRLLSRLQAQMTNDETKVLVGRLEEAEIRTVEKLQNILKEALPDTVRVSCRSASTYSRLHTVKLGP